MTDFWLQSALKNDVLVAELLLRVKHSPDSDLDFDLDLDSDSLRLKHPPPPITVTSFTPILPPRWGHRKYRSKSATAGGKEHRGSPTTHLSWSGGSISDGCDESSRPSDLSSGCRSVKVNEGASTSSCNRFEKRKSFLDPKDDESSLFNERIHINKESNTMRATLNQQVVTCPNLKRIKIDVDQNQRNKMNLTVKHERQMKFPSLVTQSCRVEAETERPQRGFVLPDLNMTPDEEDLAKMMS
ncbi:hypothetical protein SSX86_001189 [Deinandra increscens subsp. villosa]|uniref:Uncharacterized protein n=1 Tax=Deinandra increscens subsp. villosa TaxID=3103831 RepID=A0AAP0DVN7_9ASTR